MPIFRIPVDLSWSGSGSPGVNVFHFDTEDGDEGSTLQIFTTLLQGFYDDLGTVMGGPYVASFAGECIDVETGAILPSIPWSRTYPTTTGYAPLATAICVTWRTAFASRSAIGRTFLGPVRNDAVDNNGTPTTEVLADVRSAATTFLEGVSAAFADIPGRFVVYSRVNGTGAEVQSSRVNDSFAVLRSRRD